MNPRYTYPPKVMVGLLRDLLLLQRRSFEADARVIIAGLKPPLRVQGRGFIPSGEPCVLTMNHYTRAGFHIWWAALAISSLMASPVHWVMAGEWTTPGRWYEPFKSGLSRFVARRLAHIYDFTSMPPMPPRAADVAARADSVRAVLAYVKQNRQCAKIGLAPEGGDQPGGGLIRPVPGGGRFCLLLAAQKLRFVPVGVYEARRELHLNFGRAFELTVPDGLSAKARDEAAAEVIMRSIAVLLPRKFRGEYS
jgi:hypothetical protein